jgi:casein kinase II subunit beta
VEYITDKFNLTGLYSEVDKLSRVVDVITDSLKMDEFTDEQREQLEYNARLLYGLVHARYVLTARGLQKMHEKYKKADFGYCSRVHCSLQHLLPVGLSDHSDVCGVKLYCPKCEDLYNPKSSRHASIDGAFFGTSFPGMFLQAYPRSVPTHPVERYIPKVFGFALHDHAKLARWQELQRIKLEKRLIANGIDTRGDVPNGYYFYEQEEDDDNKDETEEVK